MTQPEALRLADILEKMPLGECDHQAAAELRRIHAENEKLRTVMVAAAEEIAAHWDAHCDSDGYGPVNLMRRLEEGIAAEYGYTAGEFGRLHAQRDALLEALKLARSIIGHPEPDRQAPLIYPWDGHGSCPDWLPHKAVADASMS